MKDLGVTISNDLKWANHCKSIAGRATSVAFAILRVFQYRDRQFLCNLYKTFARSILENCSQIWNPYLKVDIEIIEKVQRQFTKGIFGFNDDASYNDRLSILNLESLECRRHKADMILLFQIYHGLIDLNFNDYFIKDINNRTRGHSKKLYLAAKDTVKMNLCCLKFFSIRTVNLWNSLPAKLIECTSLKQFKSNIRMIDIMNFI